MTDFDCKEGKGSLRGARQGVRSRSGPFNDKCFYSFPKSLLEFYP